MHQAMRAMAAAVSARSRIVESFMVGFFLLVAERQRAHASEDGYRRG